ncbi:MAG: CoB--CoM heterodisulfide reductase iron-sulfur subunit B family protein [Defluviitaleaceae bacterium]|nr:CoB--CoM heterodisulfide reductase iron-sulfur subunit B family protein [Defluviitaleaceae bacterium]
MDFLYYPGCTLSTTAKQLDTYARLCAKELGIGLEEVKDWQCCGAVFPLTSGQIGPKLAAVRVLVQSRDKNKPLITLCAACHHVIKQVNHQAKNDAEFREIIKNYDAQLTYAGEATVYHYMEVLRQYIGFDAIKKMTTNPLKGRKIGAYYGCLLLRPSDVMQFDDAEDPRMMEDFIRALGATAIPYPMRNECCGGYRALQDEEGTRTLCERIIASALSHGVRTVVTLCPLCQYQLTAAAGGDLDVCYFTELLAEALDIDDDE